VHHVGILYDSFILCNKYVHKHSCYRFNPVIDTQLEEKIALKQNS